MKKNVAVVMGGYSSEFDISIKSGQVVYNNLKGDLHNCYRIIIRKDKWTHLDENNEDENSDDTSHHEDGSPATKVRRVSTDEWSSRVLMEYAARRRYAAETAREMARAERRRLRKEEREAARRANVGSREASASSSGATTTTSGGGGGDKKRKASEEAAVPISRFFTPRGSSPSPPA